MPARRSLMRVMGWALALLCGMACADPRLIVVVTLPDSADRDRLTIALSIYAPAAASEVDCARLAADAASLDALRADRVYSKVLLSPADGVANIRDGVAAVPSAGTKIVHALGAYGAAPGVDLDPRAAALVGCEMVGAIEDDVYVTVPLRDTGR